MHCRDIAQGNNRIYIILILATVYNESRPAPVKYTAQFIDGKNRIYIRNKIHETSLFQADTL